MQEKLDALLKRYESLEEDFSDIEKIYEDEFNNQAVKYTVKAPVFNKKDDVKEKYIYMIKLYLWLQNEYNELVSCLNENLYEKAENNIENNQEINHNIKYGYLQEIDMSDVSALKIELQTLEQKKESFVDFVSKEGPDPKKGCFYG